MGVIPSGFEPRSRHSVHHNELRRSRGFRWEAAALRLVMILVISHREAQRDAQGRGANGGRRRDGLRALQADHPRALVGEPTPVSAKMKEASR